MKTAVLLSGGVDSSVALRLLQTEGYKDITAFYLKIWLEDELAYLGSCPWEEDLAYAREVCEQAGVPLKVVPLQREYFDRVVQYAITELKAGRTPSPDIFCNQRIKFGAFYDFIAGEYQRIATGHYAQVLSSEEAAELLERETDPNLSFLGQAPDPVKDQTYFLSHLHQQQLQRALFPLGRFYKNEVRELAQEFDLPNKERKDSQGICFLGKIKYPEFVSHYLGKKPGKIIERETGKELGEHQGFWFHTIGQRQGLGLGNGPWYVAEKDTERNIVYVSHGTNPSTRERSSFLAVNLNWISGSPEADELVCKLRHGPVLTACKVTPAEHNGEPALQVEMEQPDRGVAPGQFSVFYKNGVCLGGGMILVDE